jgi:hypothetical protein
MYCHAQQLALIYFHAHVHSTKSNARTHTHTDTHTHIHARTHARTHAHTHTHAPVNYLSSRRTFFRFDGAKKADKILFEYRVGLDQVSCLHFGYFLEGRPITIMTTILFPSQSLACPPLMFACIGATAVKKTDKTGRQPASQSHVFLHTVAHAQVRAHT